MMTDKCLAFETCPEWVSWPPPDPAFEGAVGFGMYAQLAIDEVLPPTYTVTTLSDYHPLTESPITGSLRKIFAEMSTGGGIIRFTGLEGEINLKAPLGMLGSHVSIEGQTAAGEGITITGNQFVVADGHDVIIRYMRFRSGFNPNPAQHCQRSLVVISEYAPVYNVIIDHCSIGASQDDDLSFWGLICSATVQNCIIGGGVYTDSKGGIGSGGLTAEPGNNITFSHNLITNSFSRQMAFGGPGRVDFYNNVISNGLHGTELMSYDGSHAPQINILYNWYRTPTLQTYTDPTDSSIHNYDPILARETDVSCDPPCGEVYVPNNEERFHVDGNRFERYDPVGEDWEEPYFGEDPWDLTVNFVRSGSFTTNLDTDLKRDTPWTPMGQGGDLYDSPVDPEDMGNNVVTPVLNNAGCRMPLAEDPPDNLDDFDQILVVAHGDGDVIYPSTSFETKNMIPGIVTDPNPLSSLDPVVSVGLDELAWEESDETEYFKVYFKKQGDASFTYVDQVAGVGDGNTATVGIPGSFLPLEAGTCYKWRVDAYNGCSGLESIGAAIGLEWTFKTLVE